VRGTGAAWDQSELRLSRWRSDSDAEQGVEDEQEGDAGSAVQGCGVERDGS